MRSIVRGIVTQAGGGIQTVVVDRDVASYITGRVVIVHEPTYDMMDTLAAKAITPEARAVLDAIPAWIAIVTHNDGQISGIRSVRSHEVQRLVDAGKAYVASLATSSAPPVPSIDNVHYSGNHLEVRFDNNKTIHIEFINPDLAADATIQIPTTKEQ